jgi:RND superfamily putative drug exporter
MIIAVVIGLSFLLLMLAFRSIMIPLSAAVMNLLSVAASYGVLVMVFQWGWGASLLGYPGVQSIPIASYVPLMMFAVLFGLSMDYEVFLMSQITEHHSAGLNDHDAVVAGLAYSARVITAAALIMVSVFASFILNSNPVVKQFGVGLSVAVALDSTIVRILLVPATMTLLGKANWWLPKWLARILPHLNIEGTGFFDDKDGQPPAPKADAATSAVAKA